MHGFGNPIGGLLFFCVGVGETKNCFDEDGGGKKGERQRVINKRRRSVRLPCSCIPYGRM